MPKHLSSGQYIGYGLIIMMQITMAIVGTWLLITGDIKYASLSFLPLALSFLPLLVRRKTGISLPVSFHTVYVTFLFLSFFVGEVFRMYRLWWPWDAVLHFAGGILLAFAGFLLVYVLSKKSGTRMQTWLMVLFAFCFSITAGSVWEIIEFTSDLSFGTSSQDNSLLDTMEDIAANMAGSVLTAIAVIFYLRGLHVPLFSHSTRKFLTSLDKQG